MTRPAIVFLPRKLIKNTLLAGALVSRLTWGQCDLSAYKPALGLTAVQRLGVVEVSWAGERGEQLRASFALKDGQPAVAELAARKGAAKWVVLGRNLTPEFQVT